VTVLPSAASQATPVVQGGQLPYGHDDQALIAAISTALATGASLTAISTALLPFLYATGIRLKVLKAALILAESSRLPAVSPPGPAVNVTVQAETAFRSMYVLNAARRLQAAWNSDGIPGLRAAVATERRYLQQHKEAQANRAWAAELVDRAAAGENIPLRWKAVLDGRTSPECRAADGGLFWPSRPPAIGYPGTVHPHCRCTPELSDTDRGRTVDEQAAGHAMRH
jgi:hypothetical protein